MVEQLGHVELSLRQTGRYDSLGTKTQAENLGSNSEREGKHTVGESETERERESAGERERQTEREREEGDA